MSDDGDRRSSIGASPVVIVKGGTTSSSFDKEIAKQQHIAEMGRAHQDKQMAAAAKGDHMSKDGFVSSRLLSMKMMDSGSPQLVLYYMNRDGSVRQECISELVIMADGDMTFTLVCPKCMERGVPPGLAQIMVRCSHRKFTLDPRHAGTITLITPDGPRMVRTCGTVYSEEILKCANYGCTWRVKVDNSKVYEV